MIPIIINDSIELPFGISLTEAEVHVMVRSKGLENIHNIKIEDAHCEVFLNSWSGVIRVGRTEMEK